MFVRRVVRSIVSGLAIGMGGPGRGEVWVGGYGNSVHLMPLAHFGLRESPSLPPREESRAVAGHAACTIWPHLRRSNYFLPFCYQYERTYGACPGGYPAVGACGKGQRPANVGSLARKNEQERRRCGNVIPLKSQRKPGFRG